MFSRISLNLISILRQIRNQTSNDFTQILRSILHKIVNKSPVSRIRQFAYFYMLFLMFRFFALFYFIHNKVYFYTRVEMVLSTLVVNSTSLLNPGVFITSGLFNIFILSVDYTLHVRPDAFVWSLVYDWMIENRRDFYKLNPGLTKPKLSFFKPFRAFKSTQKSLLKINASSNHLVFACRQLPHYKPVISVVIRARAVIIAEVLQFSLGSLFVFFRTVQLVAIFSYMLRLYRLYQPPLVLLPLLALDMSLVFLRLLHFFRLLIFLFYSKLLLAYVECCHLQEINRTLGKISRKTTITQKSFWNNFKAFSKEHTAIGVIAEQANRRIISRLLFASIIGNITFNLAILATLFFLKTQLIAKLAGFFICGTQLFFWFIIAQPMIRLSVLYHASGGTLMRLAVKNFKTTANSVENLVYLKNKLKLMTACELVHTENRLYFTVGPIGGVSYANAGKFVFKYLSYFLFIAAILRKG